MSYRKTAAASSGLAAVLLDSMREGVSLSAEDGTIVYTNPAEDRIFGYEPGELIGQHVSVQNAYPPDENARVVAEVIAELQRSGSWRGEWLNRRKDGTEFVTSSRISSIEVDGRRHWLCVQEDVTERRNLEQAERAVAQRLQLAVDAGRMAVWDLDLATEQVTGSPELNRVLGFPDQASPTMDEIRARYYPGERERLQALGQASMARGERFFEAEYRYVWPDGSIRWLLLRAEAVMNAAGVPVRAVGVVMDVTSRKVTEDELRASESRLRLAQQAAGLGVWDWDVVTGAIEWSPEMYDILGLDREQDSAAPYGAWLEVLHPDDRDAADAAARRVAAEGGQLATDFRVIRRGTGETRWVRSHGAAVAGAGGAVQRVVGIILDTTQEREREEGLRSLAGQLQSAVETGVRERDRIYELSNDLFAVAGFDGYLKTINPAWERLLGYSKAQLLERPFGEIIHPDDHAGATEFISAMLNGQSLQRFEDRLIAADGRIVWISWAAVPEGDKFYAVGRDVTHDKLSEEALRQAQKMEAVGQLTGGIAHDFNNLLQAVHGSLDLIRRRPGSDKVPRWAESGLQAAERGAKLTAQLLAFSRAQRLELKPVSVQEALTAIDDLITRTLGPSVRVNWDFPETDLIAMADPTQLEMAVLNLAINSRDAMPDGGDLTIAAKRRRISGHADLPDGEYVELAVTDTGQGMPLDVQARAFDPFFTTKGVGKGTGLGLSQVYGMAKQAGGAVSMESRLGGGTKVKLLLRQAASAPANPGQVAVNGAPSTAPSAATILVVDDDPDVRRFLSESIEALGYNVMQAEDGPEGLLALERITPDLLLIDFAMPGMNGAEVAAVVRQRHPNVPIVFASGYADTNAIDQAVGASAPVLRKPFAVSELETMLGKFLA